MRLFVPPICASLKISGIILFLLLIGVPLSAQISLPKIISDGVVLQRDTELKIWGKASPDETVTLHVDRHRYKTVADKAGNWQIILPAHDAGGPFDLLFKGKNEIKVSNVLFGDVWMCSGQSNMVLQLERVKEKYPEVIANATYPQIRHFFIPTLTNLEGPQNDLPFGSWKEANQADVLNFSAVAYFFARKVYEKYHVPIGLVNASVGGTPIEAWLSEKGIGEFPDLLRTYTFNRDSLQAKKPKPVSGGASGNPASRTPVSGGASGNPASRTPVSGGASGNPASPARPADLGMAEDVKWFDVNYVPIGWNRINIPGYWEDQGIRDLNGVVWYRREVDIPESMTYVPAKLFMGRIIDADILFVNGKQVGNTTYQYPPRRYEIPAGILKQGKNLIVIRVQNTTGKGGFVPDKSYYLTANGQNIDLKGDWHYKVGEVFPPVKTSGSLKAPFSAQNQPAALFNAMVAPLTNLRIKGFLWYQGETNGGNPIPYRKYLPALIRDWRTLWNQGDLPFLYVQLANYMDVDYSPVESNWAELRNSQRHALTLPKTAMAVTIDLGEWNDVHPLNKKEVGERLALGAFNLAYYDTSVEYSGPLYQSFTREENKMVLNFSHIGSGLVSVNELNAHGPNETGPGHPEGDSGTHQAGTSFSIKQNDFQSGESLSSQGKTLSHEGDPLARFEVAGPDGIFVKANAEIRGDQVVVWNEKVPFPEVVRYAWADNPHGANLYNKEGLPASPFTTYDRELADSQPWRGKQCAVVLTYDDGLNVHLDHAIVQLDSLGMKGTFYIPGAAQSFQNRSAEWRRAAAYGHELGNHTLYHPCDGSKPGRNWVGREYDLSKYSVVRFMDEIRTTNDILGLVDGKKERTFAYTCGDMNAGNESFAGKIAETFPGARGVRQGMHKITEIDLNNVDAYVINGQDGNYMVDIVKKATETNSLVVFLFHGVGGEHNMNVSLPAHRQLLQFLKDNEDKVWVPTMLEAVKHIKAYNDSSLP